MRNSMKVAATTTLILVVTLLAATPATAQQEPPGGWLSMAYRNAMNVPTGIAANYDSYRCENDIATGRFPAGCIDFQRRLFSGQIPRLLWDAREYEYWTRGYGIGYYGNFGNYGPGQLGWGNGGYWFRPSGAEAAITLGTVIGLGVADLIFDHRRGNDRKKAIQENTAAVAKQAEVERELLEELRKKNAEPAPAPAAPAASAPAPVQAQVPAGSGTVLNGTGCDLVLLDKAGKRVYVPKGTEAALVLEGIQSSIVNGQCPWDLSITFNKDRASAVLTCSPPTGGGN